MDCSEKKRKKTDFRSRLRRGLVLVALVAPPYFSVSAAQILDLQVTLQDDRYRVVSQTLVAAPVEAVYDLLVDYENFHQISSVFTESRYLSRDGAGNGVVYTMAKGCLLFFCRSLERVETLEVESGRTIITEAIPDRSDVKYGYSKWQLAPHADGTMVQYFSELEPGFWVPPVVGPWVLKRTLMSAGRRAADRLEASAQRRMAASEAAVVTTE